MQQRIEVAEKVFVVLVLFVFSGSLFPFNMDSYTTGGWEPTNVSPNHMFRFVLGGIYCVTGLLLLYRWKDAMAAVKACPWIVLLLALVCCSFLWSTELALTLRRATAFLGTTMVGFYLASRFSLQETSSLLAISFALAIFFSLVLITFFPEYGINPAPHQGAWRGVLADKSLFGEYFSVAFLIFLLNAAFGRGVKVPMSLLGLACCAYFVYMSQSKTALVLLLLTAAAFAVCVVLMPSQRRTRALWVTVAFVLAILMFWSGHSLLGKQHPNTHNTHTETNAEGNSLYSESLQVLGRDTTLTGRTVIWSEVLDKAIERPVAGYGYIGHIWPLHIGEPYSGIRKVIKQKLNFYLNHSHNGYIQLFLALGGAGVLLFFLIVSALAKDWILCVVRTGVGYETMWSGLFLTWLLAINITDDVLVGQNVIYWPLLIVATVHLREEASKSRATQQAISITERE